MKVLFVFILSVISLKLQSSECNKAPSYKSFYPKYAKHFSIDYFKDFKRINVDKYHYILSDNLSLDCKFDGVLIHTPVKKIAMTSTTYLPALVMLKKQSSLTAFQNTHYIVDNSFDQKVIKELSYNFNPEELLSLKLDLVMGYESNLTYEKQKNLFNSLRIPLVINKDFEEKSPLARAEWLIFIASFYNLEPDAIEEFRAIEKSYLQIKSQNQLSKFRPTVIVGDIQNGYWMTCGGQSDLGQMISDAGAILVLNRDSSQTQKIDLEELSQLKKGIDFWLPQNLWTSKAEMEQVMANKSHYQLIKTKQTFNNNNVLNRWKFNAYWEEGMQRPDLVLKDLSAIFHPELHRNYNLKWYKRI